ncbi:MAG: AAA family ATPase [Candidatus Azotimanducaceae bacterium WSBS_2022_MAG_OTU7]
MLTKLALKGYRSCVDTAFSPTKTLSVLIGPNGSGKTNLLNGVLLLRKLAEENPAPFNRRIPTRPTTEVTVKAWFEYEDKKAILTANIGIFTDENNNDIVVESEQSWYLKDYTGSAERVKLSLADASMLLSDNDNEPGKTYSHTRNFRRKHLRMAAYGKAPDNKAAIEAIKAIARISRWVSGITYYSASQFTNPSDCPVSIEVELATNHDLSRQPRSAMAARFLDNLYNAHREETRGYKDFVEIIGPKGLALIESLTFKELPTSSVDYSVRVGGQVNERKVEKILVVPQFKIGKNILSPNQLSEGTFKTIALVFYLLTEKKTLLLVGEPEVCVHHGLLNSILEIIQLQADDEQVMISTHSDYVLDQVDPTCVFTVARQSSGETTINNLKTAMASNDFSVLKGFLANEGSLGEYWKTGGFEEQWTLE